MDPQPRASARDLLFLPSSDGAIFRSLDNLPKHLGDRFQLEHIVPDGRTLREVIRDLLVPLQDSADEFTTRRIEHRLLDTSLAVGSFFGGLSTLKGLQCLDVACGARVQPGPLFVSVNGVQFEPWRARFLSALGMDVIGVDIRESSPEPYKHVVMDLDQSLLSSLKAGPFDLVVWVNYLGFCPHEYREVTGRNLSRELKAQLLKLVKDTAGIYDGESVHPVKAVTL